MQVTKYDTLKDTTGQTWRVTDVNGEELKIKKVIEGKNAPGKARTISIAEVGEQYRLLDLPKVTVTQIDKDGPDLTVERDLTVEVKKIFASGDPDAIDDLIITDAEKMLDAENEELREKLKLAHTELDAMENEVATLNKTISKMKQAHAAEVEELNDEIMELKIIAKKKNEYADALDDDSGAFGKIRSVAAAIAGMADSIQSLAYMVQDETEGRE